jgi:acetyltransferase-like isoleucine patch superfamily enzyme
MPRPASPPTVSPDPHATGRRLAAGVDPGAHLSSRAAVAADVSVAPGAVIGAGVSVGAGAVVGSGAVIHDGTEIGARCVIEDGAILGKRPRLRARSTAPRGELAPLVVGPGASICAGAVVYAGAVIGAEAIIGDQAHVRERVTIGERTVIGRGSSVELDARVGARVIVQSNVYVTSGTVIEDDVFLGPAVVTTNDHTMGRHPREEPTPGPVFRRACRVGGGVVVVPGIVVGAEAFVAAGAVVTADVAERAVVMGVPARFVREVEDEDLLERWR